MRQTVTVALVVLALMGVGACQKNLRLEQLATQQAVVLQLYMDDQGACKLTQKTPGKVQTAPGRDVKWFVDLALGQRAGAQQVRQVPAGDVLHDQHVQLAERVEIMDGRDVGVVQLRQRQRFTPEPPPRVLVDRADAGQDLDGHIALEALVARAIHRSHAARADRLENTVVPQGLLD